MGKKPDQMPSPSHTGATAFPCSTSPGSGRSPGEGNGNPLQYSCLGNPMDRRVWWATVRGVTKESDMTQRLYNKRKRRTLHPTRADTHSFQVNKKHSPR